MKDYRLISSLSYFSIFFAAFIFPLAVYFIVQDEEVKYHAKRALFSHLIPLLTILILLASIFTFSYSPVNMVIFVIVVAIINFAILIWNIVQGIKIFI